jgi:hypothetical protein
MSVARTMALPRRLSPWIGVLLALFGCSDPTGMGSGLYPLEGTWVGGGQERFGSNTYHSASLTIKMQESGGRLSGTWSITYNGVPDSGAGTISGSARTERSCLDYVDGSRHCTDDTLLTLTLTSTTPGYPTLYVRDAYVLAEAVPVRIQGEYMSGSDISSSGRYANVVFTKQR